MDLTELLSQNYVFDGVDPAVLAEISRTVLVREFNGGDLLVRQFDKSSDILILIEGTALGRTFSGEVVARFGPGSVIGEVALIDGQPRSSNVASVGPTKVMVVPSFVVKTVMDHNPVAGLTIMRNLAVVLCQRLRQANENMDSLAAVKGETART